jgi:hypothetical protein
VANEATDKPKLVITEESIEAMLKRAQKGDTAALEAVRTLMLVPEAVDYFGNLSAQVERALIRRVVGDGVLGREAVIAKLATMRAELGGGPEATPIERLLVERVLIGWLHLHGLEVSSAGMIDTSGGAVTIERAITSAHKRYIAAIKALALVRRLAIPALQINIAKKQVNLAGQVVTPESATVTKINCPQAGGSNV